MEIPALKFENVSKRYGTGPAVLREVSLQIAPGEFFGLAGVNGAGKTSLIKCMLDLADFSSGAISIFGASSRQFSARARLAYLPERFLPPHYLTGGDFLKMMATLHGHPHDAQRVATVFDQLDLDAAALERPVRNYSKGMTQKLGLAATFLARRSLLILDEPMSGLDPKARALVKDRLFELKREGVTLFFTSHALADIDEICDQVAILHDGHIAYHGTPSGLLENTGASTLERAFLKTIQGTSPSPS